MIHGPSSFNLDTSEAEARLYDLEEKQKQANLSQAQAEHINALATPDGLENWLKKRNAKNNSLSPSDEEGVTRDTNGFNANREIRLENRMDRIGNRMNNAYDNGNIERGQRLQEKMNKVGGKLNSGGASADWGGGAISALSQAPSIIANLSQKPETQGQANSKVLNSTVQGASIGTQILPGWGTAIGAVVGFAGGAISNNGWYDKVLAEADTETRKKLAEGIKERKQGYIKNKTSDQLKAEADAYARALGYSPKSYNT